MSSTMELITIECDLTADLQENPKKTSSSISIKFRRFRQTAYRKPNGDETIKEHKLIAPPTELTYEFNSVLDIDSVLNKSTLNVNNWVRNRVSDSLSLKAARFMREGKAYSVKAEVDVVYEKIYHHSTKIKIEEDEEEEEEEKSCAICLGEFNGKIRCTEFRCGHVFHRACIWKWLRKSMSCPYCRRCVCGKESCRCSLDSDTY